MYSEVASNTLSFCSMVSSKPQQNNSTNTPYISLIAFNRQVDYGVNCMGFSQRQHLLVAMESSENRSILLLFSALMDKWMIIVGVISTLFVYKVHATSCFVSFCVDAFTLCAYHHWCVRPLGHVWRRNHSTMIAFLSTHKVPLQIKLTAHISFSLSLSAPSSYFHWKPHSYNENNNYKTETMLWIYVSFRMT